MRIKAVVTPQKEIQVTEYKINASSLRLDDIFDVDTSGASDGAVLVYSGDTSTFQATTIIENENTEVNGGNY